MLILFEIISYTYNCTTIVHLKQEYENNYVISMECDSFTYIEFIDLKLLNYVCQILKSLIHYKFLFRNQNSTERHGSFLMRTVLFWPTGQLEQLL